MTKVGDKLGRYELLEELGRGATGIVFKAKDTLLDDVVCLKLLIEGLVHDEDVLARFKRELLIARKVTHPGVCKSFDLQQDGENTFLIMEFVEGEDLATRLERKRRLEVTEAVRVMRGASQALGAAHKEGVIHRDLKPANILVRPDGRVSVVDFGIATADDMAKLTRPGLVLGSRKFVAPERWMGEPATPRTDVWALGVILYGCVTGRLPYNGEGTFGVFDAIQTTTPTTPSSINPEVSGLLDDIIAKALAVEPDERYADASELDDALAVLDGAGWNPSDGLRTPLGDRPGPAGSVAVPREVSLAGARSPPVTSGGDARKAAPPGRPDDGDALPERSPASEEVSPDAATRVSKAPSDPSLTLEVAPAIEDEGATVEQQFSGILDDSGPAPPAGPSPGAPDAQSILDAATYQDFLVPHTSPDQTLADISDADREPGPIAAGPRATGGLPPPVDDAQAPSAEDVNGEVAAAAFFEDTDFDAVPDRDSPAAPPAAQEPPPPRELKTWVVRIRDTEPGPAGRRAGPALPIPALALGAAGVALVVMLGVVVAWPGAPDPDEVADPGDERTGDGEPADPAAATGSGGGPAEGPAKGAATSAKPGDAKPAGASGAGGEVDEADDDDDDDEDPTGAQAKDGQDEEEGGEEGGEGNALLDEWEFGGVGGESDDEDEDEDEEGAEEASSGSGPSSDAVAKKRYLQARRTLGTAMDKKGVLPGDSPALDRVRAKMAQSARKKDFKGALSFAQDARRALSKTSIDRDLVSRKLSRLNKRYDGIADAERRKKVADAMRAAQKPFSNGDWEAANRALNKAFRLVPKS